MPACLFSDRRQLKKQLLEAASQISDDEDDTVMESSFPNYRIHLEAFQDSQDPYDMWQIRQKEDKRPKDKMTECRQIQKDILTEYYSQILIDRKATVH